MKWYVGISATTHAYTAFRANATPTEVSGDLAVIGPFKTKRAALWVQRYGKGNPHFQHVNDAEKYAKNEGSNMKHRFKVIEYASYYAVRDSVTGEEEAMSDGVDSVHTPTGKAMRPGSEYFRKTWERMLNDPLNETLEAYFPYQYDKEGIEND
jgi:hypothetical protein